MNDLRLALRQLIRSPGFALLAIITLGLGIGANTAMFSVINSIMLKPLPYPDSAQLDRIDRATLQNPQGRVSPADFLDLQREMHRYGEIGAYALGDTSLSEPGQPAEMVEALRTTANFFSVLRIQPQLGCDFLPREDLPGNDRVILISQRCWQQRFGGRTDVIGRTIRVDGEPHEIVGVLPAVLNDWRHLGSIDFFRRLLSTNRNPPTAAAPFSGSSAVAPKNFPTPKPKALSPTSARVSRPIFPRSTPAAPGGLSRLTAQLCQRTAPPCWRC